MYKSVLSFVFVSSAVLSILATSHARITSGPNECTPAEHWVSPHSRVQNGKSESVTGHCRSNPNGYKFWKPKISNARPRGWPHKQEHTKKWKPDETEKALCALATLPEELWIEKLKGIYRMDKSKDRLNPASNGDRHIVLYDDAMNGPVPLNRMLAHELAHVKFDGLSDKDKDAYYATTGWGDPRKYGLKVKGWVQRKEGYVRESGKVYPTEDFANNVEYYLFEPEKLKTTTPHAYTWIKNHFGDNFKIREVPCDK